MNPTLVRLAAALLMAAPLAAAAHVSVTPAAAPAGSYVRLAFGVPHGCRGSATTEVVLRLPHEALIGAKPMPKPGWTITIERKPLARPFELHGRRITDSVAEIRWRGGPLAHEHYDEFVLSGRLADDARGPLPIAVLQTCEQGRNDWVGPPGSESPAPVLEVQPAAEHRHH